MLVIFHTDAQFVLLKDVVLNHAAGVYYLDEGQPLGLLKSESGSFYIGESDGDQIELPPAIGEELLNYCSPCEFELALNDDGDSYVREKFIEQKLSLTEKVSRITIAEKINAKTILVNSIS